MNGFKHQKGNKYTSLREYKLSNPLENEKVEEIIKEDLKELLQAPESLEDRINSIIKANTSKDQLAQLVENMEAKTEIEEARASNILNVKEIEAEEKATKKRGRKNH